jgi:hypothetical protein
MDVKPLLSQRNLPADRPSGPSCGVAADVVMSFARPSSASSPARADVALLYAPPVYINLRERAPITVQSERSDDELAG